ncbi:hypothetical protein NIES4101_78560 [Calothrix sp. NIES-4101]|nr:hypothetical protein NIES4101_78560 [Calothrix sp. NIES-4101]
MSQMPNLQSGITSQEVQRLQSDLSRLGYQVSVNGTFDQITENAVKKFQKDNNLTVDGIVAAETGRALGIALAKA